MYEAKRNITAELKKSGLSGFGRMKKNEELSKIEVLEKFGSVYKVIIDGRVFQSRLPLNAVKGEVILGRLLSSEPPVIKINNLYNSSAGVNIAVYAAGILGMEKSVSARKVISILLKKNLPLVKSRIEFYAELFEKMNIYDEDVIDQFTAITGGLKDPRQHSEYFSYLMITDDTLFGEIRNEVSKHPENCHLLNLVDDLGKPGANDLLESADLDNRCEADIFGGETHSKIEKLLAVYLIQNKYYSFSNIFRKMMVEKTGRILLVTLKRKIKNDLENKIEIIAELYSETGKEILYEGTITGETFSYSTDVVYDGESAAEFNSEFTGKFSYVLRGLRSPVQSRKTMESLNVLA